MILGVLIVVVSSSIPPVGGWPAFLITPFGLGAFILEMWPRRRPPQPS